MLYYTLLHHDYTCIVTSGRRINHISFALRQTVWHVWQLFHQVRGWVQHPLTSWQLHRTSVNVRLFISPAKNRCSSIPTNIRQTQGRSAQQSKPPNRSHCLINPLWDEAFFLTQTNLSSGMGVRVTHDMYHQSVHPKDGSIIQGGAGLPNWSCTSWIHSGHISYFEQDLQLHKTR